MPSQSPDRTEPSGVAPHRDIDPKTKIADFNRATAATLRDYLTRFSGVLDEDRATVELLAATLERAMQQGFAPATIEAIRADCRTWVRKMLHDHARLGERLRRAVRFDLEEMPPNERS